MDVVTFLEMKLLDVCSSGGLIVPRNAISFQICLKRFLQFDQKNAQKA
jgi:hypothetical protein